MCQPDFCGGTLVLIWQLLIGTGVVFIYFGLCPLCVASLLPIGLILIAFGVGVFVYWVWFSGCQPSLCKIFFEIANLAIVQTVIGFLQIFLGACIWAGGPIVMFIYTGIIQIVGSVGLVWACLGRPPQN
jgi:hypothetical protein